MIVSSSSELDEKDLLPARMLNEFAYCPRLFYLEHVEGLFAHNADTVEGAARHARVDAKTDELPDATKAKEIESIHARSVTLSSDRLGVIAKLDLVETENDLAVPVDYKRGAPRKLDDGTLTAWDPERIQLCVQALVLRENGFRCDEGIIFFWETRQRVRVPIDDDLVKLTLETVEKAQQVMLARTMPPPLVDSPKCPRCSLVSICLPDETRRCTAISDSNNESPVQPLLFDIGPQFRVQSGDQADVAPTPARQLITVRDERRPLYLNTQGYSVGVSGQVIQVKDKGAKVQEVRINDVSQVNLFGAVQVSTQAIQALLAAEIPLVYFSFGGWFHGMTQSVGLKNIMWRREQFRMADRADFCLQLARELVAGKIRNQRTLLMRNHIEPPPEVAKFLKAMIWESERAESISSLLGIEGMAAKAYFQHFAGMIKVDAGSSCVDATSGPDGDMGASDADQAMKAHRTSAESNGRNGKETFFRFDFERRNRRPPRDPVNALLSLGYSLLAKDLTIVCATVGLDPFLGFYHQPRFGRPALALDMMEPFRALVVDSAVLSAINQRMVTTKSFVQAGDAVALTPDGRKAFFQAYEQRMDQLVTHPLFGYRVSYRRVLEIQVRLLARVLTGEIRSYPVFVTR